MEKPPVFYHTMGKVKYYYGETWPLPQTKFTPYYFASEKGANSADGDGRLQMEIPTDGKPLTNTITIPQIRFPAAPAS